LNRLKVRWHTVSWTVWMSALEKHQHTGRIRVVAIGMHTQWTMCRTRLRANMLDGELLRYDRKCGFRSVATQRPSAGIEKEPA
jgi:hypothetical protein